MHKLCTVSSGDEQIFAVVTLQIATQRQDSEVPYHLPRGG
jgi:precorrin-3B methylase